MKIKYLIHEFKTAREEIRKIRKTYKNRPKMIVGQRRKYLLNHRTFGNVYNEYLHIINCLNPLTWYYSIKWHIQDKILEMQGYSIYPESIGIDENGNEIYSQIHMNDFDISQWSHDPK